MITFESTNKTGPAAGKQERDPSQFNRGKFMQTLTSPQTLILLYLDLDQDFSPLDEAIEEAKPYGCKTVEFVDDNRKRGYRALEYRVRIVARHEHDEDGWSPVYEWHTFSVAVNSKMTVKSILFLILGEINHLIAS